jgi:DNA processing protein
MSKGCNDLIKAQKAYVLTSAEDVMLQLNWQQKPTQTPVQKKLFVELYRSRAHRVAGFARNRQRTIGLYCDKKQLSDFTNG